LDHTTGDGDNFGNWIVLKADGADQATQEIMKSFGITKDRSDDLSDDNSTPDAPVSENTPVTGNLETPLKLQ